MRPSEIRLLGLAASAVLLSTGLNSQAQSSNFALTTGASGQEIITFHSPDRKFRLVIEDTERSTNFGLPSNEDDEAATKLDAYMISGEGEKEKTVWRTKIPAVIYELSQEDAVLVSPRGDFFVVTPNNWRNRSFRIFTASGAKSLEYPKQGKDELTVSNGEWIVGLDTVQTMPVLKIWDQKSDRWLAFSTPDGRKIGVDAELTGRWNNSMRTKIRDLVAQKKQEVMRDRIERAAPQLQRLTSIVAPKERVQFKDVYYEFLLRRKVPEDRNIFVAMLEKKMAPEQRMRGWFCGTGRTWRDNYNFSEGNYEREHADGLLARWDGKATREDGYYYLEKPYMLARLSGTVKLAAPILTNGGKVHIHLIPTGKENGAWTNEVNAEHLECTLPTAWAEQSDLMDEINYSFGAITPGNYFLKAIWDKRAPTNDVLAPGPGDYESKLIGPLAIKAGHVLTNLNIVCTNRAKAGAAYYSADLAAVRSWKAGELSPGMFSSVSFGLPGLMGQTGEAAELFSRRAEQWILKTNTAPSNGGRRLVRAALGHTHLPSRKRYTANEEYPTVQALQFYLSDSEDRMDFERIKLAIIDEHGCEYNSQEGSSGWRGRSAVTFPRYPQTSKTFRLVATIGYEEKLLWDLTLTNLLATNAPSVAKGSRLPTSTNLGPVTLKISGVRTDDAELVVNHSFVKSDGGSISGWKLIDCDLIDANGVDVVESGMCREETSMILRGTMVRDEEAAPNRWKINVQHLPQPTKFLPLDFETNVIGMNINVLGIVGSGTTTFELVNTMYNGSMSMSGADREISIGGKKVKVKSKENLLVLMTDQKSDDVVLYLRGLEESEDDRLRDDFELNQRTRLIFLPISKIEKSGAVELSFSADRKIPVELPIELPSDFKISSAQKFGR